MEKTRSAKAWMLVIQSIFWLCIIVFPGMIAYIMVGSDVNVLESAWKTFGNICPFIALYFLNYLVFIPKFLFRQGHKKWFYLSNVLIILIINACMAARMMGEVKSMSFPDISLHWNRAPFIMVICTDVVYFVDILIAVGVRNIVRMGELQNRLYQEESQRKNAEITWLRNQLNPHFLFNAMNNISSLTQTDPDRAQEELGRLSDVLRYSLYDASHAEVPLSGEIEFMKEYISLMELRCNELADISVTFNVDGDNVMIAPLLFISLIENAFKHGVSSRQASFVHVFMTREDNDLVFICSNSLFAAHEGDRSGSGIGLENIKHRLELLYPGRHHFFHGEKDGAYVSEIRIKNIMANG